MRLTLKIAAAMTAGILLVMTVDGFLRVERQVSMLSTDMQRDHLVMGRSLAAAIGEIWLTEGEPLAQDIIDRINERIVRMDLRWIRVGDDFAAADLTPGQAAALAAGGETSTVDTEADGQRYLKTYVPVVVRGLGVGSIEITESMRDQAALAPAIAHRVATAMGATLALAAAVLFALGFVLVGRPVRKLVAGARRIGDGDFSSPIDVAHNDELGLLAKEMNAMAGRIDEAHRRLAAETAARIATLQQLRHADRLKTVGQATSGIVHDLGTPLTVVAARARMIETGEVAGEEALENARVIREQAERMTKMIRRILRLARRGETDKEVGDLAEVTDSITSLLAPMALKTGVSLAWDGGGTSALVLMDAGQIQQTLANLVINGIQATPAGGKLALRLKLVSATPPAAQDREPHSYWALTVEDHGPGIPDDVLPRIFDPFFTTKGGSEGTGLGLSIAREIVAEHGGWIAVDSAPGRGSRFTVHLPAEANGK